MTAPRYFALNLSAETLYKVTAALVVSGHTDLAHELESSCAQPDEMLKTGAVKKLLGVSSLNTVKNWLEGGCFPGAVRTPGGHWLFPRSEVEAVMARMADLRARNEAGALDPRDVDQDDLEFPAL